MVARQGLVLTATGLVVGVGISLPATNVLGSLLVGVRPTDPGAYGAVVVFLFGVALLASYLPARWATRIDPASALRKE